MLEAAVIARVPIINANNVVKRIRCAPVRILHRSDVPQYHSQIAQQGSLRWSAGWFAFHSRYTVILYTSVTKPVRSG